MLKYKSSKNFGFHFCILFIITLGLFPFSIQAQEDGTGTAPKLDIDKVKKEAQGGNATAMVLLGNAYLFGKNISKDSIEAMKWFTKAAEKGNPAAMSILGNLYDNKSGLL